jgi:hypothetical protein
MHRQSGRLHLHAGRLRENRDGFLDASHSHRQRERCNVVGGYLDDDRRAREARELRDDFVVARLEADEDELSFFVGECGAIVDADADARHHGARCILDGPSDRSDTRLRGDDDECHTRGQQHDG